MNAVTILLFCIIEVDIGIQTPNKFLKVYKNKCFSSEVTDVGISPILPVFSGSMVLSSLRTVELLVVLSTPISVLSQRDIHTGVSLKPFGSN